MANHQAVLFRGARPKGLTTTIEESCKGGGRNAFSIRRSREANGLARSKWDGALSPPRRIRLIDLPGKMGELIEERKSVHDIDGYRLV